MKRRRLSPEEEALWRQVAATASPLRVELPSSLPRPAPQPAAEPAVAAPKAANPRAHGPDRATLEYVSGRRASAERQHISMDMRRFEKLRRGRLEPEARLDLHGMSSERAHRALSDFILAAHASGLRLVLVITGKGRPGEADAHAPLRSGVLRHSVPHWLAMPPLIGKVLQVAPAHNRHGGLGALYIYLRRTR